MDYTQSVYLPEAALQHSKDFQELEMKEQLIKKAGLSGDNANQAVLVQMLKQLRSQ